MYRTKASTCPQSETLNGQIGREETADLRSRFREFQLLRQMVRIAECGRVAPSLDNSFHQTNFARNENSKLKGSSDSKPGSRARSGDGERAPRRRASR
jgi:hypothetical protein